MRVSNGLVVLFDENGQDIGGVGDPMNLTPSGSAFLTDGPATKVISACKATNEVTIEAWATPVNLTDSGPARIITLSKDAGARNFTIGQEATVYEWRLRTQDTQSNGQPYVELGAVRLQTQHLVLVNDNNANVILYVDGQEIHREVRPGGLSTWDNSYRLAIGDEISRDRPWAGTFHLGGVYNRALTEAEVQQNFAAGPDGEQEPPHDYLVQNVGAECSLYMPSSASGARRRTAKGRTYPAYADSCTYSYGTLFGGS